MLCGAVYAYFEFLLGPLSAARQTALKDTAALEPQIKATAEQLTQAARWRLILSAAFQRFLRGKVLGSVGRLAEATGFKFFPEID